MPLAVVLKAVALGAAATTGAAGLVWSATASEPENPAVVWVDNPLQGASVEPGVVTVTSHASAKDAVQDLVLMVDGARAGTDTTLERNGLLSLGSFDWQATPGKHDLVVKSGSTSSDIVTVYVVARGNAPLPTSVPTARPSASASATPSLTPSPTAGPTTSPTSRPTVSPTPVTTTAPPPTKSPTPKPSPPVYASGSIAFSHNNLYWDTNSGGNPCPQPHTVVASVTVTNATSVSIRVGDRSFAATRNGTTWSATVDTSQISGPHNQTNLPVKVLAQGPGGSASSDAGTVSVYSCTKD